MGASEYHDLLTQVVELTNDYNVEHGFVIHGWPDDEFGEDYTYEMRVETSVVPAKDGDTNVHCYTPGWSDGE